MNPGAPRARAPVPPTRPSMVEGARSEDAGERRAAFERVVQAYWQPVYAYLRMRGAAPEDAEDLTQGFFARAFEKRFFDGYDPARARFRTFVRTCLDGYAANERAADRRLKRGGGVPVLSLDFAAAERALPEPAAPASDPDDVFHREWVRAVCAEAVEEVRRRCRASGREAALQLFERCDLSDLADADRPSYAVLAGELGLPPTQVTNLLASARREFRAALRDTLRARTASDAECEDEARRLLGRGAR